jgi:hypothetical protein
MRKAGNASVAGWHAQGRMGDEAKIAMGENRSIKELDKSEWSHYWGAVQHVPDRSGGEYRLRRDREPLHSIGRGSV